MNVGWFLGTILLPSLLFSTTTLSRNVVKIVTKATGSIWGAICTLVLSTLVLKTALLYRWKTSIVVASKLNRKSYASKVRKFYFKNGLQIILQNLPNE
jgi:hypothetical protein